MSNGRVLSFKRASAAGQMKPEFALFQSAGRAVGSTAGTRGFGASGGVIGLSSILTLPSNQFFFQSANFGSVILLPSGVVVNSTPAGIAPVPRTVPFSSTATNALATNFALGSPFLRTP